MLTDYGVTVTPGAGPHGLVRADALARLETMHAIERIGGGRDTRTQAMWVNPPVPLDQEPARMPDTTLNWSP